jgi:glycosyltransferase involved in cell wall biosynthesis
MCVCVSVEDQAKLASICPGIETEVIPNGVDLDYFKPEAIDQDRVNLVFTGSMDWQPNEDAVLYFCNHILPLIRAELPEIEFYIVGSNPSERVLRLRELKGVVVTGSVEDVRPYIADASVYVVPLRIGGGTRLKILQALAMRKAVVSTSIGCEGLNLQPDDHLLVADEPQPFAAHVIRLAKDRPFRDRLGRNGGVLVQKKYNWDIIVKRLDLAYRRLASNMP